VGSNETLLLKEGDRRISPLLKILGQSPLNAMVKVRLSEGKVLGSEKVKD
jgi:hypothetical protein